MNTIKNEPQPVQDLCQEALHPSTPPLGKTTLNMEVPKRTFRLTPERVALEPDQQDELNMNGSLTVDQPYSTTPVQDSPVHEHTALDHGESVGGSAEYEEFEGFEDTPALEDDNDSGDQEHTEETSDETGDGICEDDGMSEVERSADGESGEKSDDEDEGGTPCNEQHQLAVAEAQETPEENSSDSSEIDSLSRPDPQAFLDVEVDQTGGFGGRKTKRVFNIKDEVRKVLELYVEAKLKIPREELQVVKWSKDPCVYSEEPDVRAWLVKSAVTKVGFKVWTSSAFMKEIEAIHPDACRTNLVHTGRPRRYGFVNGASLSELSTRIITCTGEDRPTWLWRAVHDGMPHGGIRARGHDRVLNDTVFFQRHLQSHLVWRSRRLSPFISTSSALHRAVRFAAMFEARKQTGIKILMILTVGRHWDHGKSRLWCLTDLMPRLGLAPAEHNRYEYLVENSIPPQHIKTFDWDSVKDVWDRNQRAREWYGVGDSDDEDEEEVEGEGGPTTVTRKRKRPEEGVEGVEGENIEGEKKRRWTKRFTKYNTTIRERYT